MAFCKEYGRERLNIFSTVEKEKTNKMLTEVFLLDSIVCFYSNNLMKTC